MPELPEVETTRRGIEHLIAQRVVTDVRVRDGRLRWPVPRNLRALLIDQQLQRIERRAKYLLLRFKHGTVILHLGMSGSLRVIDAATAPGPWDHVDLVFAGDRCLRLRDPRRFGSIHWTAAPVERHPLLQSLGPEPLGADFTGAYLHARAHDRTVAVKNFLMDGHVVVGVGNIYASEALHLARIHPERGAGRISASRYDDLAGSVRQVLGDAIDSGGTTLRDFVNADGNPGYFRQQLRVYDRAGEACRCGAAAIRRIVTGQRATYYCPACQR